MTDITIIGAGVVGETTGKGLAEKGNRVVFVDIKREVVEKLREEGYEAYLPGQINTSESEVGMFCVQTPSSKNGSINLKYLIQATISYGKDLKQKRGNSKNVIVIRSTVPPGTTRKLIIPLIEKHSGMKRSEDFGVCVQPEFLRVVSRYDDFLNPWAIVIGELDKYSGDVVKKIYSVFRKSKIFRCSLEIAELSKYVHNCFNATKISFSNEIWLLGKKLGIDANKALTIASHTAEGYWNAEYGTVGGQAYGGSCLPKDTFALKRFAERIGCEMPLLGAVIATNLKIENMGLSGKIKGPKWRPSPVPVKERKGR